MTAKILVVDDEKNIRKSLQAVLEDAGYVVHIADQALSAVECLAARPFDLIIIDIRLPEISGIQLMERIRHDGQSTPVLFISGNASLTEAVETIRKGGADFLEKPFTPERLLIAVERALRLGELERKLSELAKSSSSTNGNLRRTIVGESRAIESLWHSIQRVAPTRGKVLISGESGVGKELVARAIHDLGTGSGRPFIRVNCAAIPETLIESELFGHEKGAFTGAIQQKKGLFELAHGGTLFLDEIAELSLGAQAKILRAIQSQEILRVGGNRPVCIDVRFIAATHRDLARAAKDGTFREDLLYRINVVPITVPSLRDRIEDLPLLVHHLIRDCARENGIAPKELTAEALDVMTRYPWPGNVRELRNALERALILSDEVITESDLPIEINSRSLGGGTNQQIASDGTLQAFKERSERAHIVDTLKSMRGNVSQAAKILGIERTYLHRKIQEHEIRKGEYF